MFTLPMYELLDASSTAADDSGDQRSSLLLCQAFGRLNTFGEVLKA
jgi:hypothetical protein